MKRYTSKSLVPDVASLNAKLAAMGHDKRLIVANRYNYAAVDLATIEQLARHCCQRNLETGTPRECLHAAQMYVFGVMESANAA